MLTPKQLRFCIEYPVDFNATQAAIRAGYSEHSAGTEGTRLLENAEIRERVEQRKEELAAAAQLTPEWILRKWREIADGNPEDLTRVDRVNCRHCHGYGGAYQWTQREYEKALEEAIANGVEAPDGSGGFDFDLKAPPNPDCQECGGEGEEKIYIEDTRKVRGNSRGLFAGVKMGKNGIEVKLRDQAEALKNIAAWLGMNVERKEISGVVGNVSLKPSDLTDAQLAALLHAEDEKPNEPDNET